MPLTLLDPTAALVVIDLQKGIVGLNTVHPATEIVGKSAKLARAFREHNLPVVLVNVAGRAPGRIQAQFNFSPPPGWTELVPELDRQPSDYTVTKLQIGAARYRRPLKTLRRIKANWTDLVPGRMSALILLVADLLHPVDDFAVELFLGCDVRHGRSRRSTMPMFLARRKPDHIAGPDFFDGATLALHSTATGSDNEGLAQRMGMPCSSGTRFKRDRRGSCPSRIVGLKQGIDTNRAGKPVSRTFD
jgi:hypothetical protein